MYFRITEDLKARVDTAVRKIRFTSSLIHYPVMVVIFSACAVWLVIVKAHFLIRWIVEGSNLRFSETEALAMIAVVVTASVAVGLVYILRGMNRERIFEEHHFCGRCTAVDKDDDGICPFCNQTLNHKQTFFVTVFDDEIQLASRFGLTPAKESEQ